MAASADLPPPVPPLPSREPEGGFVVSEAHYRLLAEHIRDLVTVHLADGTLTYASPSAQGLLGYLPAEIVGRHPSVLIHPDDCLQARRALRGHLGERRESVLVHRLRRKDGSWVWTETTSRTRIHPDNPKVVEIVSTTRDITKRRRAEEEMIKVHALLDAVYETVPFGLCLLDETNRVVQANLAFARLFETESYLLAGKRVEDLLPAAALARIQAGVGSPQACDVAAPRAETFPAELCLLEISTGRGEFHRLITANDLRPRRRIETRLREASQLESLATLAGGIAHDFNNLFAIVLGYASLLRDPGHDPARIAQHADIIIDACHRGADVVRQLQLFANQQDPEFHPVDVHHLIDGVLSETAPARPPGVRIVRAFGAVEPNVRADARQLEQALRHLVSNAFEAMPQGGTLTLRTHEASRPPASDPAGSPVSVVRIEVSDTGKGMDAATRARMFEPFFAHRNSAGMRGLGLAVVHGVLRAHGGSAEVDSAPGEGSTIRVFLPRQPPCQQPTLPAVSACRRTILVVHNDAEVGRLWQGLLAEERLPCVWARDGEEALKAWQASPAPFALLFSEASLPGMDGWALASALRRHDPGLPVILADASFKDALPAPGTLAQPVWFVPKPYLPASVIARIHALLPLG
jgi:two-component system, cell cycle sensor histidine kinase and response regulator CckA